MAEIPIQRKEGGGGGIWPWLLGLLAVLAIGWFVVGRNSDPDTVATVADTTATSAVGGDVSSGVTSAMSEFSSWVDQRPAEGAVAREHQYAIGGIRRLADALAAAGATGDGLGVMRRQADSLEASPTTSVLHSNMVRTAFLAATDAMRSLATPGGRGTALTEEGMANLRRAAESVRGEATLLQQRDNVHSFFAAARDALNKMTATG